MTKMHRVTNTFVGLILFFTLWGCSDEKGVSQISEQESYQIYNSLLNEFNFGEWGLHLAPPPISNDSLSFNIHKQLVDSILQVAKNQKLRISLNSVFFGKIRDEFTITDEYEEFKPLVEKLANLPDLPVNLKKLTNKQNTINVSLTNDSLLINNKQAYYEQYNLILSYSRIAFDHDYQMAAVIEGISVSRMDGHGSLIFLKKKNGEWETIGSLSI